MKKFWFALLALIATSMTVQADIVITEVAPWASGNSPYLGDWFELTNTGASAVDLTGWRWDDNSNDVASGSDLVGVSSIAAGQSVVFLDLAASPTAFTNSWFGANVPAGFTIGSFDGPGLGTGGDAVNIYNAGGVLQARVDFFASSAGPAFATFDNAQGLNNATISQLSVVGVNGAFVAANSISPNSQIGSPGSISAVPEPGSMLLFGAVAGLGAIARRRRQTRA